MKLPPTNKSSQTKLLVILSLSTALLLVTPIIVMVFVGLFLDSVFNSRPFITIFMTLIGGVGGTMNVFRLITNYKVMH